MYQIMVSWICFLFVCLLTFLVSFFYSQMAAYPSVFFLLEMIKRNGLVKREGDSGILFKVL